MIKISNKTYSFFALLFVVLTAFGYQIVTSLFLPVIGDSSAVSRSVTYPYRSLMLVLAGMLIVFRPKYAITVCNRKTAFFFVGFFLVYCIKILLDIFLFNVYVDPGWRSTTLQYMFLSVLPSMWAAIQCAQYIDYERLNKWLLWCSIAMLAILIINQNSLLQVEYEEMSRMNANIAMNSISLGHMGVTLFFVFFSWILAHDRKPIIKAALLLLMALSFVIMLRAASRGPLVAFFVMSLLIIYSSIKNKAIAITLTLIIIVIVLVNTDALLNFVARISPMMSQRIAAMAYEGDSSGRDFLYTNAIDIFLNNPLFGKKFVLDIGYYSHNSLLDVLMALGVFGGIAWIYLMIKDVTISYHYILDRSSFMITCLLSVQMLLKSMFSGAIYTNNQLIVFMSLVLLINKPILRNNE